MSLPSTAAPSAQCKRTEWRLSSSRSTSTRRVSFESAVQGTQINWVTKTDAGQSTSLRREFTEVGVDACEARPEEPLRQLVRRYGVERRRTASLLPHQRGRVLDPDAGANGGAVR
ncbi:hypothetical protein BDI4_290020 [Burkholderia diffusa]|nr:hypothetical protein BDI4_290020 [Burkholderia diffusa]